ncbi:hypothetical protein Tco_0163446 [Tanacetum coccineum]
MIALPGRVKHKAILALGFECCPIKVITTIDSNLRDLGLLAWHIHVGVGFCYYDGFGVMWGGQQGMRGTGLGYDEFGGKGWERCTVFQNAGYGFEGLSQMAPQESLIKECENVKLEYQKIFNSIKTTQAQHQKEVNELVENVNQKTYAYADVRSQNQDLLMIISELKTKLKYAEKGKNSKLKEKVLVNSILHGPYVRRMIVNRARLVAESTHEQTDDELTNKEAKQMEADDQAIQIILMGFLEDIYAAEKKAKLFNEREMFNSTEGESVESYYHHFTKLMNDFVKNKHYPEPIANNLKFLNNLQPEWK